MSTKSSKKKKMHCRLEDIDNVDRNISCFQSLQIEKQALKIVTKSCSPFDIDKLKETGSFTQSLTHHRTPGSAMPLVLWLTAWLRQLLWLFLAANTLILVIDIFVQLVL